LILLQQAIGGLLWGFLFHAVHRLRITSVTGNFSIVLTPLFSVD